MEVNVQNTCVRVFTQDEVVNLQPLVVLTQDLSGVAQQDTLVQGITDIRDDISHIDIDTSTLAKQGTNTGASLTATQTAATNAYASAEAAKTGVVDGNDTAVGVAKEIRGEVGTGSDTAAESGTLFAVVKWVKDKVKSIFNLIGSPAQGQPSTLFAAIAAGGGGGGDAQESTSQEILSRIGSAGSGQSATLFGAVGDIALSATTLQSLADSWAAMVTNRNSVAGWTFSSGTEINGAGDLIARLDQLVSIDDNYVTQISSANVVSLAPMLTSIKFNEATTITSIYFGKGTIISSAIFPKLDTIATTGGYFFQNSSYLTTLQLPLLKYINGAYFLSGCSAITSVSLPLVEVLASNGLSSMTAVEEVSIPKLKLLTQVFQTCQSLKSLDLSGLTGQVSGHYNALSGCPNLIKVITGSNLQSNMALANWNPTNALSSSSTSLVEQGESFTSNLEKFLYNIRTYIAANLPDRTGMTSLTFTFNAAVKSAINADTATANAFTNKNWTIA